MKESRIIFVHFYNTVLYHFFNQKPTQALHRLSLLILFLLGRLCKKRKAPSFHIKSGRNLSGLFFEDIHVRIDWRRRILIWRHTFKMADVCRKVLPSGECTRSNRPAPSASAVCCIYSSVRRLPADDSVHSSWSTVYSYFVPFTAKHTIKSLRSHTMQYLLLLNTCKALNGLLCANVPLRNYSLSQISLLLRTFFAFWKIQSCFFSVANWNATLHVSTVVTCRG